MIAEIHSAGRQWFHLRQHYISHSMHSCRFGTRGSLELVVAICKGMTDFCFGSDDCSEDHVVLHMVLALLKLHNLSGIVFAVKVF